MKNTIKNIWVVLILFNSFLGSISFGYENYNEFFQTLNLTDTQKQKLQKLNNKTNQAYNAAATKVYYYKKNHSELSHIETNEYRDKIMNKIKKQYESDLNSIFNPEQQKLYQDYIGLKN